MQPQSLRIERLTSEERARHGELNALPGRPVIRVELGVLQRAQAFSRSLAEGRRKLKRHLHQRRRPRSVDDFQVLAAQKIEIDLPGEGFLGPVVLECYDPDVAMLGRVGRSVTPSPPRPRCRK